MTGISDKQQVILINLFQQVLTKNYSSVLEKPRVKITYTKTGNTTSLVPLVGGLLNFSVSIFSVLTVVELSQWCHSQRENKQGHRFPAIFTGRTLRSFAQVSSTTILATT